MIKILATKQKRKCPVIISKFFWFSQSVMLGSKLKQMRMAKTGLKCANVQKFNWKLNGCVIYLLASKILFNLADSCCSTVSHSVSHHNFLFHNCHQDTYFDFSRNESGLTRFIYSLYKVNSSCRMYVFVLVSWSRMCVERRAITHDQPTKWQYSQWREKVDWSWNHFFVVSLIFFHFLLL